MSRELEDAPVLVPGRSARYYRRRKIWAVPVGLVAVAAVTAVAILLPMTDGETSAAVFIAVMCIPAATGYFHVRFIEAQRREKRAGYTTLASSEYWIDGMQTLDASVFWLLDPKTGEAIHPPLLPK